MTALFMLSASPLNTKLLLLTMGAAISFAQQLPDGPGKLDTQKLCSQCHEISRSISVRQDRAGWQGVMSKMSTLGMKGSDQELQAAFEYLVSHYPADEVPKLNINTAEAVDIESALTLRRSQASAVIAYREKHGAFKTIDDLKKVPGLDPAKIEAKKDRLIFN